MDPHDERSLPGEDEPTDPGLPEPTGTVDPADMTPEVVETPASTRSVNDRPIMPIGLVLSLIFGVLLVIFAVQNTQTVDINFLWWSGQAPLILALTAAVVAAIIVDEAIGLILRNRRRRRRESAEELDRLRNQH